MSGRVCGTCGRVEGSPSPTPGKKIDLRPYGPGGSLICVPCAFATPEAEERTKRAFGGLLEANAAISPTGIVAIGEPNGPRPFDPAEAARDAEAREAQR